MARLPEASHRAIDVPEAADGVAPVRESSAFTSAQLHRLDRFRQTAGDETEAVAGGRSPAGGGQDTGTEMRRLEDRMTSDVRAVPALLIAAALTLPGVGPAQALKVATSNTGADGGTDYCTAEHAPARR